MSSEISPPTLCVHLELRRRLYAKLPLWFYCLMFLSHEWLDATPSIKPPNCELMQSSYGREAANSDLISQWYNWSKSNRCFVSLTLSIFFTLVWARFFISSLYIGAWITSSGIARKSLTTKLAVLFLQAPWTEQAIPPRLNTFPNRWTFLSGHRFLVPGTHLEVTFRFWWRNREPWNNLWSSGIGSTSHTSE